MNSKKSLRDLPVWDGVPRLLNWLESFSRPTFASQDGVKDFPPLGQREFSLEKDDLLAAEVTLPLAPACDVSRVRSVRLRRPFARHAELMLVDVSRLTAA